jgi:hypothetical protein
MQEFLKPESLELKSKLIPREDLEIVISLETPLDNQATLRLISKTRRQVILKTTAGVNEKSNKYDVTLNMPRIILKTGQSSVTDINSSNPTNYSTSTIRGNIFAFGPNGESIHGATNLYKNLHGCVRISQQASQELKNSGVDLGTKITVQEGFFQSNSNLGNWSAKQNNKQIPIIPKKP